MTNLTPRMVNLKYFTIFLILNILVLIIIFIPQILTLESQKNDENKIDENDYPFSCTRWQFYDFSDRLCKNSSGNSYYYDLLYSLEKITIPFIGAAAIFVITTTTPRISKVKRVAMIIPCGVLLGYSLFVIFSGVRW